ncbi:SDR family NAD(P)-dependent oxidoreductase [Dongia sedimenti]|uniref:SDR family oxidoreductase n=1 Tax=Dongia sedimenti TaxID=3064282 RepID=A0ABU0YIF9_9PROT|nr:SDR family oxidoreductase [Rhodospirillaceae bacterium R-7]
MTALAGKTALVTGAHRGIGAACALALAEQGAQLILADRLDCSETAAAIPGALAYDLDVADEGSVLALFDVAKRMAKRLDILVHCAGIIQEKPLLETSAADFDAVIAVNLRGSFLVGREALRWMRDRQPQPGAEARAILIASDMSYYGREQFSAYVASKHGVLGLVRSWAREFAPAILVNAICPGPIDTAMLDAAHMSPEWRAKELQIPLARFGEAREIGALAAFLAGPGGRYFTGQGLGPNGGSVMP